MRFENSNKYGSLAPEELVAHLEKIGLTLPEDYQDSIKSLFVALVKIKEV